MTDTAEPTTNATTPALTFIPYEGRHLAMLPMEPKDRHRRDHLIKLGYAETLAVPGLSWTAVDGVTGQPVACGGFMLFHARRAQAWSLVGVVTPQQDAQLVRKMVAEIRSAHDQGITRIEMAVARESGAGAELASVLGFTVQSVAEKYYEDGSDAFLFAKVAQSAPAGIATGGL